MDKRQTRDLIIIVILTVVFLVAITPYTKNRRLDTDNSNFVTDEIPINKNADFNVWYTDSSIKEYIEESSKSFSFVLNINYIQVPALDYLENINKLNLTGKNMPDIYIIESDMLEKAYLAGLTSENDSDKFNEDNYHKVALSAATYHDKLVAYPLCFDTGFLVYNKDYVKDPPESFDDILEFAQSFDAASQGVENILKWDVKNIIYNYGFIGNHVELGGENGDDSSALIFDREGLVDSLNYYHNLHQYFSIDINTIDYDTVVDEFVNGKTVFSILGIDAIEKLNNSGINYGIARFPHISGGNKSKSLSATKLAVVNPYAKNTDKAKKFAEYLTYGNAKNIYKSTKYMPSRKLDKYEGYGPKEVMEIYKDTSNLPNLMSAGDYWLQLQNMLNRVWDGGDINTELDNLYNRIISYSNIK